MGAFNHEMIATSHDSWCGLVVIIYVELQKQHRKVEIYTPPPESYTCTDGICFLGRVEAQSFERSQEAEQYKCLKGSLDSIPFHLFSFTQNLQTVFCVSQRGLDLCGEAAVLPFR